MADRAVGTATSYPLDRTHLPPCDEISCHSGSKASSRVYPSRIKFGDPTSPFGGADLLPTPSTSVGTVMVSGPTGGQVNDSGSYNATASGDAVPKSYTWSAVGGIVSGSGSSVTVNWTVEGAGSVTCSVRSSDENVTDSPQSDTINTTISPEPPPATSIGVLTMQGFAFVTTGDQAAYAISNNGDAKGLSYLWTVSGGTGSSDNEIIDIVWGEAGAGKVTCKVTSSDPGVTDSPKSKVTDITIGSI